MAMEIFRQQSCFFSVACARIVDKHSYSSSMPSYCSLSGRVMGSGDYGIRLEPQKIYGAAEPHSSGFKDKGHLQYYYGGTDLGSCVGKKEKSKGTKRKLKLLKGLSKDLSMFSRMSSGADSDGALVGEANGNLISDAAQELMKQLQQLEAEEKELKRKKEKAKLKSTRMTTLLDSESSSSSESSDSECDEMIGMTQLRNIEEVAIKKQPLPSELQKGIQDEAINVCLPILASQELRAVAMSFQDHGLKEKNAEHFGGASINCRNDCSLKCSDGSSRSKKIEVCMGNKCKKSGGAALMEEFERVMGVEGCVVAGCKCMGKCRDGPNVRILNYADQRVEDSLRTQANPLCIGVGLEDVGVIVAKFFGGDKEHSSLTPAF